MNKIPLSLSSQYYINFVFLFSATRLCWPTHTDVPGSRDSQFEYFCYIYAQSKVVWKKKKLKIIFIYSNVSPRPVFGGGCMNNTLYTWYEYWRFMGIFFIPNCSLLIAGINIIWANGRPRIRRVSADIKYK